MRHGRSSSGTNGADRLPRSPVRSQIRKRVWHVEPSLHDPDTVYAWLDYYQDSGLAGLVDHLHGGARRRDGL